MSSGASSQTAAETPERSSVRIAHDAMTPTVLDYADADDDADDYDYGSGTEGLYQHPERRPHPAHEDACVHVHMRIRYSKVHEQGRQAARQRRMIED